MNAKQLVEAVSPEARHNKELKEEVKRIVDRLESLGSRLEELLPGTGFSEVVSVFKDDINDTLKQALKPRAEQKKATGLLPNPAELAKALKKQFGGKWSVDEETEDLDITVVKEAADMHDIAVNDGDARIYYFHRKTNNRSAIALVTAAAIPGAFVLLDAQSDKVGDAYDDVVGNAEEVVAALSEVWTSEDDY